MRIALAGNPNCGKTTMYNALTGKNEKIGNWAGVTVDKKEAYIEEKMMLPTPKGKAKWSNMSERRREGQEQVSWIEEEYFFSRFL